MATSTYKTFLMVENAGTYERLIPIKSHPDLGGEPEMIDVTNLEQAMRAYVTGVQDTGALSFTANYDSTDYDTVAAYEGATQNFSVWFGGTVSGTTVTPTGSEGKFSFSGTLSVYVNAGEVNGAREMTITIAPSTEIVKG